MPESKLAKVVPFIRNEDNTIALVKASRAELVEEGYQRIIVDPRKINKAIEILENLIAIFGNRIKLREIRLYIKNDYPAFVTTDEYEDSGVFVTLAPLIEVRDAKNEEVEA